jgi:hypothetical protein
VQVAVSGVEHVADPQPGPLLERANSSEHFAELRSRNDAVLDVVVGRDPSHRGEGRLPSLPDACALIVIARDLDFGAASTAANAFDELEETLDLRLCAIELDDEHGFCAREIRVHRRLRGFDREPVHHLDRGRDDSGGNDLRHGVACRFGRFERGENRLH